MARRWWRTQPTGTGRCLARVALDLGYRGIAVETLMKLITISGVEIDQPFFPPCQRYEGMSPEGCESEWFAAASNEQFELCRRYSSWFLDNQLLRLRWLCQSGFPSPEISRRLILAAARWGSGAPDLETHLDPEYRHHNPAYWTKAGLPDLVGLV